MIWGAISFHSRTPLVVIRRNLTAQRYVDEVLRPVVLPFMSRHPGLIFQQDNARPHTAHVSIACRSACRTLPWPARSPDLSAIQHVWSIMGRALQPARDVYDLTRQLERIWHNFPQEDIRNLYQSMPSRITACPLAQGIILTFKALYVKQTFRYILEQMENDESLTLLDAWKKFTILDCVKHVGLSYTQVKQSTLNTCWKAIWPDAAEDENDKLPLEHEYSPVTKLA
ncbi:Transposable element Tc1 transposase, partial [Stegodyphus mimosarum]